MDYLDTRALWSDGYGWAFYVFYSFCMVCTIFGMFNIITGSLSASYVHPAF